MLQIAAAIPDRNSPNQASILVEMFGVPLKNLKGY